MKFLAEYRDPKVARKIIAEIHRVTTRPWVVMEVCGGQTHAIIRSGIDRLIPREITLVHGPGCPVCVTPLETIDQALAIAASPGVIFCSFGDMLRVPGSSNDLLTARSAGADVRIVYSPLEALQLARENPGRQVAFLAIGFETTAPGNAMAIIQAEREGLENFSALVCQVLVPPALRALLASPANRVQGYLAAGHVCTITGLDEYHAIARSHRVAIVATGLEVNDILEGLLLLVEMLEAGRCEVVNQYARSVRPAGNLSAQAAVAKVFEVADQKWRGLGELPGSGLKIRREYQKYDAARRFAVSSLAVAEPAECLSGLVLQGLKRPDECGAFGRRCTPESPLGATMVSSEGACAAYFRYKPLN